MLNLSKSMLKTRIMGVLNVTPDSFSDGGKFFDLEKAIAHAKQMAAEGADIIDIGGESSRPGSEPVSVEEEKRRVIPVIERLSREISATGGSAFGGKISIDTYKPAVARAALDAGAAMINDISGLRDPDMAALAAERQVPVVIMHMLGNPKTMQSDPVYTDVVAEIKEYLNQQIETARRAGLRDIIVDPGIGFGKTVEHNLQILKRLREFTDLGCPVLVGPSRKSFIGQITGLPVEARLEGTIAAVVVAVMNGASYVRVHDVAECRRAIQVVEAISHET